MAEVTPIELQVVDFAVREHRSLWVDAWRRLISSSTARLGMFVVSSCFHHAGAFLLEIRSEDDLDYTFKFKPPT